MTAPAATAPNLPGFGFVRQLGSGGFADVYLYEQELPRREVAVKVLHDGVSEHAAATFTSEANLMAQLSTHPSIVTIFQAAVARDGRPYLVMEYYSQPNLSVRCRQRPLSIDEALDVMVRICGAVETAHRAGIVHRDIKPSNILTSAYGKPGLTDFGISAAKADLSERDSGLSIPWSAPEVIEVSAAADERSDVYSLAATLYNALAGRSPFEIPGRRNTQLDLLARVTAGNAPPLDRSDVPMGLRRIIQMAMDVEPANRPPSAAALARMLQEVEVSLHLQVTPLDLIGHESATMSHDEQEPPEDSDVGTRVRGATIIRPHASPSQISDRVIRKIPATPGAVSRVPTVPPVPVPGAPVLEDAVHGTASTALRDSIETQSQRKLRRGVLMGTAISAALAVVLGVSQLSPENAASEPDSPQPQDPVVAAPLAPTNLRIERVAEGRAVATWRNPAPHDGDFFRWERFDDDGAGTSDTITQRRLTIAGLASDDHPCLHVRVVRANGRASEPTSACEEA